MVADFGLAKISTSDKYSSMYSTEKQALPVAWCAPEVIMRKKFSSKGDVWSYGCVLWEMWSGGASLYPGMSLREVCKEVCRPDGERLSRPLRGSDEIWSLMQRCGSFAPRERPSFAEICAELESLLQ